MPALHSPGKRWLQQAGCRLRRWAAYLLLYNKAHFGESRLHYEVSPVRGGRGWELGFHCEARDKHLNRLLLYGFRRHLFEIKDTLGESIEAEMWDKGWTKIYEVYPAGELTVAYQTAVSHRLAAIITCLHPIYVQLRNDAAAI